MNNRLSPRERRHLAVVKEMDCGVCGAPGPSDAHHIEQHGDVTALDTSQSTPRSSRDTPGAKGFAEQQAHGVGARHREPLMFPR